MYFNFKVKILIDKLQPTKACFTVNYTLVIKYEIGQSSGDWHLIL